MLAMLRAGFLLLFAVSGFAAGRVDFARDIQPILEKRCFGCHGPQQQMKGVRLDRREEALKVSAKIVPLVSGKGPIVMPPIGARLTADEVAKLKAWIDEGLVYQTAVHWSFAPIQHPAVPKVKRATRNPIDNFVLAKLESEGIAPSREADKQTLLRRLSLDLTGLIPSPDEMSTFLSDTRPDAYERQVDRLLASPHFGEKWARQWLDLARYADSDGYEKDRSRPWAWRYREWVIDAINHDMPYDEFTVEQLAGDLLPNRTIDNLIATGFNRNTLTNREGGTDPEQFRDEQVLDRTATLGTVWLGLTVGCAQCHDHKYDPIKQRDFYRLSAFFNTQEEVNIPAPEPGELGPYLAAKPGYDKQRRELLDEYQISRLQAEWEDHLRYAALHPGEHQDWDFAYGEFTHNVDNARKVLFLDPAKRSEVQQLAMRDYAISSCGNLFPKDYCNGFKLGDLRSKLSKLTAQTAHISFAPVLLENDTPPKTYIHVKGDWREHGDEVQPGTPEFLPSLPAGPATRLTLAKWIVAPENPLTARVEVNRIWQEVFGRGLVNTSEDFGTQGDRPSHPELLDWLATEFVKDGWSRKQMVRLMVTSATYRQSSAARPDVAAKDPENALLSRMSRLRLPAELVRDEALYASGLLDLRIGGKSVRPPQPKGVAELSYAGSVKWEESTGADRYRRGLYIHFQRTTPYPQLTNFDAPSASLSCSRRKRTDTPLQALNLMNDPVFYEAAQALAYRVTHESTGAFGERLRFAFALTLGREPNAHERERLGKYYDDAVQARGEVSAWLEVSRVLLNLDEFITKE